jgi:hypothetical protein
LQPQPDNLIFSEDTGWQSIRPDYRPRFTDASP